MIDPGADAGLMDSLYHSALFDAETQLAIDRSLKLTACALGAPIAVLTIGDAGSFMLREFVRPDSSYGAQTVRSYTGLLQSAHAHAGRVAACTPGEDRDSVEEKSGPGGSFAAVPVAIEGLEPLGVLAVIDPAVDGGFEGAADLLTQLGESLLTELRLRVERAQQRLKEAHLASQKRVLRLIAAGASVERALRAMASHIEQQSTGTLCVIHTVDSEGRLRRVAAPSVAECVLDTLDDLRPREDGLPNEQAAFRGEAVHVADLTRHDPAGHPFIAAAIENSFRACWAFPIRSRGGVFGTIELYRVAPGLPTAEDLQLVSVATAMARIAIERRRADEALRLSEEYYRSLIENSADFIFVLDAEGRTQYVSPRVSKALGIKDPVGAAIEDLSANGDRPLVSTIVRQLTHQREVNFAWSLAAQDGSTLHMLATATNLLDNPAVGGLVINAHDVTEHKQAEKALRASEERYRLVSRATNDVIWDWVPETDKVEWSGATMSRFGYETIEMPSTAAGWGELVHDEDRAHVLDSLKRALEGIADSWSEEYRFRRKDGSWAVVLDRGFILRQADGRPTRIIGSMLDLSDRRELEEKLRQSQRMETIGRLAGGVAHDFNNLLTVISGFSAALREEESLDDSAKAAIDEVLRATDRATSLTRQLLTFSRRQVLQPRLVNLSGIVNRLGTMLGRLIGEDIRLDVQLEEAAGQVCVDPGQMEQVIVNLVVNARDAMPDGGRLLIETAAVQFDDEEAARELGVRMGRFIRLSVEDSGCGMTDDVLSRMYEPFFTTKPAGTGTGLGLSTVYGIVEQAGGAIAVRSTVGAGTRFDIYLPEESAEPQQQPTPRAEPKASSGSEALLVVEDEKAVRDLASKLLSRRGYRVHAVEDGPTALALLESGEFVPDLLLTDVILPAMNGRVIAENVKELVPGIAVVFMSGYTNEHLGNRGVLEDDVAFLEKPFTAAGLLEIIRRQLDAKGTSPEVVLVTSPNGEAGDAAR